MRILCFFAPALLLTSPLARAATLRVPADYAIIQDAIDAAVAGDTVLVAPGTYTDCDGGDCLPEVVRLKTGVDLISEGGPEVTTLGATVPSSFESMIEAPVGSAGATIQGFRITSFAGIRPGLNAGDALRLEIRDCHFDNLGPALGVQTQFGEEVVIEDCEFSAVQRAIHTYDIDVRIERCVFRECTGGTVVTMNGRERGRTAVVRDCEFRENNAGSGYSLAVTRFQAAGAITSSPPSVRCSA